MPELLFQYKTSGTLNLFNHNRSFSNDLKVQNILCSFKLRTGWIEQLYYIAYLMNPFRFLIKILISSRTVKVASSQPPGTMPMLIPSWSKCFIFGPSTPSNPVSLKMIPAKGTLIIKRLASVLKLKRGVRGSFIKIRRDVARTP